MTIATALDSFAAIAGCPAPSRATALVFSDSHFVPTATPWSGDCPEHLTALLDVFPRDHVICLGDLTEATGLGATRARALETSERLRGVFERLRARPFVLVHGNHDSSIEDLLRRIFPAATHLSRGGPWEAADLRHGHTLATPLERAVGHIVERQGTWLVPLFEHLRTALRAPPARLSSRHTARRVRRLEPALEHRFLLFGHTHEAGLDATERWANPGCFRAEARSFLRLDEGRMTLYRCAT